MTDSINMKITGPALKPLVFFAVPHRVMFLAGTLQMVLTIFFWNIELVGRYTGLWTPLNMVMPGIWVHSYLMIYGLYSFFMFGFLMTTYPRWLNTDFVPPVFYISAFALMSSGCLLFYPAIFLSRNLMVLSILIIVVGWGTGIFALLRVYLHPGKDRTPYETILLCLLVIGLLGNLSSLAWMLTNKYLFYQFTLVGGFWLFLIPVLITVSHRMIPFFNSTVLANYTMVRPVWSLPLTGICLSGHFSCMMLGLPQWLFLFDIPLAATAVYLSIAWQFYRSFSVPLLAMLHIAFLWLPVGLILYAIQSLTLFISGEFILGKAPIHTLGIGFVTSMTLAMAARVSFGHSGRPLVASRLTLACFGLLQLVTLLRIISELPLLTATDMNSHWILTAGILWLIAFLAWSWIYVPIYLKPRIDGKPG